MLLSLCAAAAGAVVASPPAPLVCAAAQPPRFVAVAWNPTCECTGNVSSDKLPCNACFVGRTMSNVACRAYSNIVDLAHMGGNIANFKLSKSQWNKPGSCGPKGYEAACNSIDFGTHANISVACAINPKDPVCTDVKPFEPTSPSGTAAQPFGEKFLLMNWVQDGQPIMTHPADALPLTKGVCPSDRVENKENPQMFSGSEWRPCPSVILC